jgi:hypothetical protein
MSAPLNPAGSSSCCSPQCSDAPAFRVPGPAGDNAFTFTTTQFVMPAVGLTVVVGMQDAQWMGLGQPLFLESAGILEVSSISGLNVTLSNTGQTLNAQPGLTIPLGKKVSPGGVGGNAGNAYTNTTAAFVMPAALSTVQVSFINTGWMVPGEPIFISNAGTFIVSSIQSGVLATIVNTGQVENVTPTTNVPGGQAATPTGFKGNTGATGFGTLNSISPTTTKGDLIVDNGANHPSANDVRLAVGTDGQILAADSSQPTGLGYKTLTPNTVANSGNIAIYNGTSGTPTPLQDSKLNITSDGAIQSTPTGGNARGSKAVDLQINRSVPTAVASGTQSVICGGNNNTSSNTNSFVGGGSGNVASGPTSAVGAGQNNTASSNQAFVGGGSSNTASGATSSVCAGVNNTASTTGSFVGGGSGNITGGFYSGVLTGINNTASGDHSGVLGGNTNTASATDSTVIGGSEGQAYLKGQVAHAAGFFAAQGDAQTSELIWRIATTDATAGVEMFLDGSALRAVVPLNTTWAFVIRLVGRSSAGVCAVWETKGGIQNNANTVSLIAANTQAVIVDGTSGTWGVTGSFAVTADNTNKSLKLAVTGAVATNIRWVAHARLVEVGF